MPDAPEDEQPPTRRRRLPDSQVARDPEQVLPDSEVPVPVQREVAGGRLLAELAKEARADDRRAKEALVRVTRLQLVASLRQARRDAGITQRTSVSAPASQSPRSAAWSPGTKV